MKNTHLLMLVSVVFVWTVMTGCDGTRSNAPIQQTEVDTIPAPDTVEVVPVVLPVADPFLTSSARLLAGLPLDEGDSLYAWTQTNEWKQHAQTMDKMWANCQVTLDKVDTIRVKDFSEINTYAKNILYTFSGPDFPFMATFFPDAETYYMMGLEPTGNVVTEKGFTAKTYGKIEKSIHVLLSSSFFITKEMAVDLHTEEVDGTIPIFMVLMARMGYNIVSIDYQDLTEKGEWVLADKHTSFVNIRFFREGEATEKSLYYLSTNIANPWFDPRVQAMIEKIDPMSTAAFVKSCSYCLHEDKYAQIREDILNHAFAIIQDDTGITYNTLLEQGWDVYLYGKYTHPIGAFPNSVYQQSLDDAYKTSDSIRPLGFRFGYNTNGSAMIVAVK